MKAGQLAPEQCAAGGFGRVRRYPGVQEAVPWCARDEDAASRITSTQELVARASDVAAGTLGPRTGVARTFSAGATRRRYMFDGITPKQRLSKCFRGRQAGGLTVLHQASPARVGHFRCGKVNASAEGGPRIESLGIIPRRTCAGDREMLVEHLERVRRWMHEAAHGRDERAVVTYSEPKSISRETTFENDLHPVRDKERLSRIFTDLCVRVADDLRRKGYVGRTIGLKLRYDNFKTVTRDRTLDEPTRDAAAIRRAAGECLKRVPLDRRIRLLGVRVGALSKSGPDAPAHPATLFE